MRHLFACLVHDRQECVVDLVRNLAALEPEASILLYNGGGDPGLLRRRFALDGNEPVVHPQPRRQRWGALHDFAIDCMRFALQELDFDALTIVDSDQLLLRAGYGARIGAFLAGHPRAGLLGSAAGPQPRTTRQPVALSAWRERELWMPYCRRFPGGEAHFPHWSFWPSTVFTVAACRDLVRTFDEDEQLAATMRASRIFATEEVVLPTLVALHGREVLLNPTSLEYVRYDVRYTPAHLRAGMARPDVYWAHPIPRRYDHPLRRLVRAQHLEPPVAAKGAAMTDRSPDVPLLLTVPILERMRSIEGWLTDHEADVLIAGLARAVAELPAPHAVVEVGSYRGRSTSVLGSVLAALRADGALYAIDPHDGKLGALDQGLIQKQPTFDAFERNIAAAGLSDIVRPLRQHSYEVTWDRPITFLLIDALHDYANVSRDFSHFERWLGPGAYVAFHDYAAYYPGVRSFVDELLAGGGFVEASRAESMILLRRSAVVEQRDRARRVTVVEHAARREDAASPVGAAAAATATDDSSTPLVSCVMPTYGRPALALDAVRRFLRQDLAASELIVVDDSPQSLAAALPDDPRIVHVRLPRRHSIGNKRNLGCEAARADVLANVDDDDWYAPHRLSYELAALAETGADVVGLSDLLYLEPATGRAWRYRWPPHGRPWVHDATLAFTRAFWQRNPFPDTSMGIDCGLLWTATRKHVVAVADERLYVGIIHPHNTSPKLTAHGCWTTHPVDDVLALLGDDSLRHLGARAPRRRRETGGR